MKRFLILLLFAFSLNCFSQSYSVGQRVFSVGDTIQLNTGSAVNKDFQYIQLGGASMLTAYNKNAGADQFNISRNYSGEKVIIRKIKKAGNKTYFVVKLCVNTCYVYIDDALKFGEVL
jgi:hypothetical protein